MIWPPSGIVIRRTAGTLPFAIKRPVWLSWPFIIVAAADWFLDIVHLYVKRWSRSRRTSSKSHIFPKSPLPTLPVATKEGGAISGEERLRENMDFVYGAISSTEGAPTGYQMARVDALERELGEVEKGFATLGDGDAKQLNIILVRAGLKPIDPVATIADADETRGGVAGALARGLIGTRYFGSFGALAETGEKD
jgi:hypothetical protein